MRKWTDKQIKILLEVLSKHTEIHEAISDFSFRVGHDVSYNAVNNVLKRRFGQGGVSEYLRGGDRNTSRDRCESSPQEVITDPEDFNPEEPLDKLEESGIVIDGLTPSREEDPEELWERVIYLQESKEKEIQKRYNQHITVKDDKPILLAMFSDMHLGGPYVDYRQIRMDAGLVANTDGAYAISTGDHRDNWIGKLERVQRSQRISFDEELTLMRAWFDMLKDKLWLVISGNHDARTQKIAGFDVTREFLRGASLLYDSDEVLFTLNIYGQRIRFKVRHKWKWKSIYNSTHGLERVERSDSEYDIAIGGHNHVGTLFRPFFYLNEMKWACLLGTYKMWDRYGVEGNFARSYGKGCGALMFFPSGKMQSWNDLGAACDYLKYLRSKR